MTRNVIVTGGGTGIGRAVATAFAADGDTVVITGRRPEPLRSTAAELGPGVQTVVCDGTDPAQVAALCAQLPEPVHVLVHCAGGNTDFDRAGIPGDIAATVHFLASPAARQITGQVLAVNGGEHTTR